MLRVFLVDDEPPARQRLRQLLAEVSDVVVVGEAGDAFEAQTAIADTHPDVVFLDIEMPQRSGTALAGSLPEPRPFIVFATAFDHYALDAFAVDATDYLVKPITRARLSGTLARVRERLSRRSDLERDLVAASAAQRLLLPRAMPTIDGYDAAAVTLPARGVGGDFFVGQQISAHKFVLALGDVAGKGMPAGLVASSLQARIETIAVHAGGTAGEVVADVNRALYATSDTARFATLAYVEIDRTLNHIAVVNAGHLPLLLIAPDDAVQYLAAAAPALGLLPQATFPEERVRMQDGATLVIYSDGITEALNDAGEEFGDDRVRDEVMRQVSQPAADICRAVVDAVRRHADVAAAADDMTVLTLTKLPRRGSNR
jgi:sigma-B regulation protein RsbU (phosphoserine phosphatase)